MLENGKQPFLIKFNSMAALQQEITLAAPSFQSRENTYSATWKLDRFELEVLPQALLARFGVTARDRGRLNQRVAVQGCARQAFVIMQSEYGTPVVEICRKAGISEANCLRIMRGCCYRRCDGWASWPSGCWQTGAHGNAPSIIAANSAGETGSSHLEKAEDSRPAWSDVR